MDSRQLFDRVRALWPSVILLRSSAECEKGAPLWSVVHVYDAIEGQIESDDWLSLGAWAFHQALTDVAQSKIKAGADDVRPADVAFESFNHLMRENLADQSWAELRGQYVSHSE